MAAEPHGVCCHFPAKSNFPTWTGVSRGVRQFSSSQRAVQGRRIYMGQQALHVAGRGSDMLVVSAALLCHL